MGAMTAIRASRGGFLRRHFGFHGARAGKLANAGFGGVRQGGDLRRQRGVEFHDGQSGGIGRVGGGLGHGAGIGDFVQVFPVDGAALAFGLGRGCRGWCGCWIAHSQFNVEC
jgi:hypothetical protein